MRITAAHRIQNENRIRAAMDRLLRGEVPAGGNCDIKTLAHEAGIDRTAFYGNRPYAKLRVEFEQRLQQLQRDGHTPDPKTAQIERLKADLDILRTRLAQANRQSINSPTFEPRPCRGWPRNTKRSSVSAPPPSRKPTSPD